VTKADAFFGAGGVIDSERLVAAILLGCEIH
jgi:hypothetical protein